MNRFTVVESLEPRVLLSVPAGFTETRVATGLAQPIAMAFAPDGRLYIAEKDGAVRVMKEGALLPDPFLRLSVETVSEAGISGIVLDPDFAENRFVYVYYTVPGTSSHNRLSRFTADSAGDSVVAGSERVLLDVEKQVSFVHNGGALHFGADGKLYVATGDGSMPTQAQSLTSLLGKMLRINPDGSIPEDNPFYAKTTGVHRAIWALGLRNPFTFAVQPGTGRMFINDVGLDTWEEVNEGCAGANFGWPEAEGPSTDPRFSTPIYAFRHESDCTAITGGTFYNPPVPQFPATYEGGYFFANYCEDYVKRLDPKTNAATVFATRLQRPVDVDVGPDGTLYYLSNARATGIGHVYAIRYTGSQVPAIGTHPEPLTVTVGRSATFSVTATGTQPMRYQWQRDGVEIPGATAATYTLSAAQLSDTGAAFRAVVRNDHGSVTSGAAVLTVTPNHAPTVRITAPAVGTRYRGGQTISYAATAADAEDGTLPPSAFTWGVDFHHSDHTHPYVSPVTGSRQGTFTISTAGELSPDVWYRIHLTVRDSGGMTYSSYRDVKPVISTITLRTSVPGVGLKLDGSPVRTPYSFTGVAGMRRSLGAPSTQTLNGVTYEFVSWSDGKGATHDITFPDAARTYTANYRVASPAVRLAPSADAYVWEGTQAARNFGTSPQLVSKTHGSGLTRHAYLKFDLRTLGSIGSAKLRLFGRMVATTPGSVGAGVFAAADTAWGEKTLTWNNRRATGATPLAQVDVTSDAERWYEWDLTTCLRQQKAAGRTAVTLVLKTLAPTKPTVAFSSRESATNRPELLVRP